MSGNKNLKTCLAICLFLLMLQQENSLAQVPAAQTWYALTSEQPAPPEIKFEGDEILVTLPGFFYSTKTVNDKEYSQIIIPRHGLFLNVGYPELPKVRFNMLIPKDAEAHCELIAVDAMDLELNTPIPSRGSILRDVDPATVPYVEGDVYRGVMPLPGKEYYVDSKFIFRGACGLPIEFYPIQYDPKQDLLRVYKTIRIKWSIDAGAYRALSFKRTNREFDEMFKETFVNYSSTSERGSLTEPGRLIIITADIFVDAVRPLAEWKIQRGLKTEIVKMSEIGTTAKDIKSYITTQYQSPESLSYVILVGDSDRDTILNDYEIPTLRGSQEGAVCDSCMAMVDGDDQYPDLFISRLSARTVAAVENQVNKFIHYEKNPDIDGAWYLKGIGVASAEAGDSGIFDWERAEELRIALETYGFTEVAKIYDPDASKDALIAALNNGASVLNYIGHGYGDSWKTTGFNITDAAALTNVYMNPFIVDVSCYNGLFVQYDACLAESFLRAGTTESPAGAIAMYSASSRTRWEPPCIMQAAVIKDLLVTGLKHTTGGLYFGGMVAALNILGDTNYGRQLVQQYNIFGDASLSVRSKKPTVLDVTYPSILPPTGPVEVEVFTQAPRKRTPLFDATVALTYRGSIVSVAQTNIEGVATLEYIELRNLSCDCAWPGDLDCDGAVNFEDLGILTDQWLKPPGVPSADIAPAPMLLTVFAPNTVPVMIKLSDGIVNFVDLSAFAEHWLKIPPLDPANNPKPPDGATEVRCDADLSWTAGCYATSQDVYFGTNFEDVNDANNSLPVGTSSYKGNQIETTFDPGIMALNTYYWRIDEVTPYGTITGPVWNFTTTSLPGQASNPNPPDGVMDVNVSPYLSWTAGYDAESHEVYFGTNNPPPFIIDQNNTTFNPGILSRGITYYWRIDELNTWGKTTGSVWRFKTVCPLDQASDPNPADGATNVNIYVTLSWTPSAGTTSHDVYFGTESPGAFQRNQTEATFSPGTLLANKTYYWRIDEVNSDCETTGTVWSFTTSGKILCFPGDTLVWVNAAPVKISTVVSGQKITAAGTLGKAKSLGEVESVQEHEGTFKCYDIAFENGNCISVVDNHYFLLDSDLWVSVHELTRGSRLQSFNGPIAIESVVKRVTPLVGKVYNLKIKDSDRYFVGKDGVIVRDY